MAWEENSRICLHMQLIAILSRIGVIIAPQCPKEVTWATTTRQTPYGLLRTEWRGSQLKAQIPVGVEAEVVWRGKRHIVGSGEWMF